MGVEHAAPQAIRAALAAPRRSDPARQAFSREDLMAAGLVAELHARASGEDRRRLEGAGCFWRPAGSCGAAQHASSSAAQAPVRAAAPFPTHASLQGGSVTARRFLVGAFLGLGDCDGKQLLRQLNRYCFTHQELAAALEWAERRLAARGAAGATGAEP